MSDELTALRERLGRISDLRNTSGLLGWDQQTVMPPRGVGARAEALATLNAVSHEMFVSSDMGRMLEEASEALDGTSADSDEARLVAVTARHWKKARRVPSELEAERARAAAVGNNAWIEARRSSNFDAFAPYLERNLELARRYVECFDDFDCAYDVLLDDYEPQMRTAEVARLFGELKAALVPMIATVAQHREAIDASLLHGHFPIERQRELVLGVVTMMGFDRQAWRMDDAVHPFASGFGSSDVRITNRWDETYFASSLYGGMHECGHGLYEAGIADSLQRTPLGHGESHGIHESQSRMWENMVGRGRPFADVLAPRLAGLFGESLAGLEPDALYRAVNVVQPSYIRVEADEATYGLHIVLRFELEQELIDGKLTVAELPEAWNSRFKEYIGMDVPDDAHGVLQDVHWSEGLFGYFPTYALGNLIAGQLWAQAYRDLPDLDASIAAGELMPLREWLREHVHRHGAKFTPPELLERVAGSSIGVEPFVSYLRTKLGEVYGLDLTA